MYYAKRIGMVTDKDSEDEDAHQPQGPHEDHLRGQLSVLEPRNS